MDRGKRGRESREGVCVWSKVRAGKWEGGSEWRTERERDYGKGGRGGKWVSKETRKEASERWREMVKGEGDEWRREGEENNMTGVGGVWEERDMSERLKEELKGRSEWRESDQKRKGGEIEIIPSYPFLSVHPFPEYSATIHKNPQSGGRVSKEQKTSQSKQATWLNLVWNLVLNRNWRNKHQNSRLKWSQHTLVTWTLKHSSYWQ